MNTIGYGVEGQSTDTPYVLSGSDAGELIQILTREEHE